MTGNDALSSPSSRSRPPALTKWERWLLAGLLVFTLVVRGAVLWGMRGNLDQDPDAYREIAENLLVHGEFALGKQIDGDWQPRPTAYRPPLYPLVLSNLPDADGLQVSLWKVAALHLVLGVATVWVVWMVMRRVHERCEMHLPDGRHSKVDCAALMHPTVAGLLVACDPILLNQQTLVMTETLAALLAILSLWCLARFDGARTPFNAAMAGGAIGLAVLCRPTFLPWLGLVGLGMLVVRGGPVFISQISNLKSAAWSWRVANAVSLMAIAAAVMSPWAIRNYQVFGKPIVTTTHGGYTLLLGNNDSFYEWLNQDHSGIPWSAENLTNKWDTDQRIGLASSSDIMMGYRFVSEYETDEENYFVAKQVAKDHPVSFVKACFYRIGQFWSPLPNQLSADESVKRRLLRYATFAWYCGVYLLAAIGVWRLRWRLFQSPWVWGVLMCLVFTAVHTFYWSNLRMRAPLMPFVAMVAATAIDRRNSRPRG